MGNQRWGRVYNEKRQRQIFESLPRPLREVIAAAPYDYEVGFVAKLLADCGNDVRAARRRLIETLCNDIVVKSRKVYGPDHPDAQRSRLERRAS